MSETLLGSGEGPAPQGDQSGAGGEGQSGQNTDTASQSNSSNSNENGGQQSQSGQNTDTSWITGYEGEDLGWLQNRGLHQKSSKDAIDNLVKGLRNAESRLGVPPDRLLKLPADKTAEGAMDAVYEALGRPKDLEGYGLEAPDGDELAASFNKELGTAFFNAGLNPEQAKLISSTLEGFMQKEFDAQNEAATLEKQTSLQNLQEEWGGKERFDINVVIAKQAVEALGATKEEIEALESSFGEDGSATVIKFFNRIGQKIGGEAPFEGGESLTNTIGALTPEAARAKMQEMKADPQFQKLLLGNHHENKDVKMYRRLAQIAGSRQ